MTDFELGIELAKMHQYFSAQSKYFREAAAKTSDQEWRAAHISRAEAFSLASSRVTNLIKKIAGNTSAKTSRKRVESD